MNHIYVRVKRYNSTYFVLCDEYEEVGAFKNRLVNLFDQHPISELKFDQEMTADDIRLCLKNRILESGASCHDQQVFNDTELWCLLRKPGTKDDFEDLETVSG